MRPPDQGVPNSILQIYMSKQQPQRSRQPRSRQRGPIRRQSETTRAFSRADDVSFSFPFDRTTLIWLVAGLAVIVIGYVLLATSVTDDPANNAGVWDNALAVTWAPIVLVVGYCVLVPLALIKRRGSSDNSTGDE